MAATRLSEVERAFFVRNLGGALTKRPLNDIKREYFISQIGGNQFSGLNDLETRWLRGIVVDDSQTPVENKAGLWKQAVISVGGTVSQFETDNKITFYLNAA